MSTAAPGRHQQGSDHCRRSQPGSNCCRNPGAAGWNGIAGQASGKVDTDQHHRQRPRQLRREEHGFHQVPSRIDRPSKDDKKQLDDLAANLTGHQGYLLEVEAHAPWRRQRRHQNSDRLAEAVKRYLVTEHEIPVYRMHSVALGNAPVSAAETGDTKPTPVRTSYVELRLMENSLAAQDGSDPPVKLIPDRCVAAVMLQPRPEAFTRA
jgi:hypothetical protein